MATAVLVGYDPASADRAPVHFGVAVARATGAPLIVGSVYADSAVVGQMGGGEMHEELGGEVGRSLEHLRRELRAEGVRAEGHALPGASAPAALHDAAKSFGAGVVVVGSSDRGRVGHVLLGSTAERLMHGAPCPVAVVPRGWEAGAGLKTVGVAYADTPEGNEALASGLALAKRARAKVRILSSVKRDTDIPAVTQRVLERASAHAPEVEVETDVSVRDAAELLIAASEQLDLLVCGSRGYGPKRAVMLGGVSRRVTAAARCPVIVLVRGLEAGLQQLLGAREEATA